MGFLGNISEDKTVDDSRLFNEFSIIEKLDLETLKTVKLACNLYSDSSSSTLGYKWICDRINEMERN